MHTTDSKKPTNGQASDDLDDLEQCLIEIESQQGRLLDKYGHEHSEAIFENWARRAIRALGIIGVNDVDDGGADE